MCTFKNYSFLTNNYKKMTSKIQSRLCIKLLSTACVAGVVLPIIYVQISAQARGIIRTPSENNQFQAAVYGEISSIYVP
jgi:hypothetical protein